MSKGTSALNSPKVLRRVNMRILYQTFGRRSKEGKGRHFDIGPGVAVLGPPLRGVTAERRSGDVGQSTGTKGMHPPALRATPLKGGPVAAVAQALIHCAK